MARVRCVSGAYDGDMVGFRCLPLEGNMARIASLLVACVIFFCGCSFLQKEDDVPLRRVVVIGDARLECAGWGSLWIDDLLPFEPHTLADKTVFVCDEWRTRLRYFIRGEAIVGVRPIRDYDAVWGIGLASPWDEFDRTLQHSGTHRLSDR